MQTKLNRKTFTPKQREAIEAQREALWDAVQGNEPDRLRALLREPSTLDFPQVEIAYHAGPHKFLSLLHVAAKCGYAEVCRVLIDAGAPLNAICYLIDEIDAPLYPLDFARGYERRKVIRLLERESDRQGIDAESMEPRVERRPDGTVRLTVVNRYIYDVVLRYGRARLAGDRAMNDPAVMRRVVELMTGKAIDESTLVTAVPMGGATSH